MPSGGRSWHWNPACAQCVAAADSDCPLWLTSASWLPGASHPYAEVLAALVTSLLTPGVMPSRTWTAALNLEHWRQQLPLLIPSARKCSLAEVLVTAAMQYLLLRQWSSGDQRCSAAVRLETAAAGAW